MNNQPIILPSTNPAGFMPQPDKDLSTKDKVLIVFSILFIICAFVFGLAFQKKIDVRQYGKVYSLVEDKVSENAPIVINLPDGVNVSALEARSKVIFNPSLEGFWSSSTDEKSLVFQPKKKLELGKYYSVTLAISGGEIKKDFLIDENPKIEAIFPNENTESSEYSSISIIFNRPMVPLTTLDETGDLKDVPVEIFPQTPGKFKWITTRDLQFIPEKRLQRSSNYTVTVKSGLISMDGLGVAGKSHTFKTRSLRYEYSSSGQIVFNQPIRIVFNQPIDLEKAKNDLIVVKNGTGAKLNVDARYGKRSVYNKETKKYEDRIDESILEIFNSEDRYGRKGLWDFKAGYSFSLPQSYPAEGDIVLNQFIKNSVSVADIIQSVNVESARSRFTDVNFFDPQGKMLVTFYEDINKDAGLIEARNMKEVGYGEKCKTDADGNVIYANDGCEKEKDSKKIFITFDSSKIDAGSQIQVVFKRIVNQKGLQLNAEDKIITLNVYPKLRILKTFPANGESNVDLTELVLCTNTPLAVATEKNFNEILQSNLPIGKWNWHSPYKIGNGEYRNNNYKCSAGEFQNTVRYGLVPESDYKLIINPLDDFGGRDSKTIEFRSGKIQQTFRKLIELQKQYNVTSPDKTKFTYGAENLEYVDLNICEVSADTMFRYTADWPDATDPPSSLNCVRTIEDRINLPKKFWTINYFQINLRDYVSDPLGHYVITLSHPEYRRMSSYWDSKMKKYVYEFGEQIFEKTFATVTNLAVQEKNVNWRTDYYSYDSKPEVTKKALANSEQNLYWVTKIGSLEAVSGASIDIYESDRESAGYGSGTTINKLVSYKTDANGLAKTEAVQNLAGAIISKGDDSTIVSANIDRIQYASLASSDVKTYMYTDSPIYRPGSKVNVKGLSRIGYDTEYSIPPVKNVSVEIFDSRGKSVLEKTVDLNDYGTFNFDFMLDTEAPLGTYRIEALSGSAYFDVEEYVPASFKIEAQADKDEYIAGDTLKMDIQADYYFGVPLEGGELEYSAVSQNYFFDKYKDGDFNFGNDWYYSYNQGYGDNFLFRGTATVDGKGVAHIEQKLDFDKFFKNESADKSKIFVFNVTVKNTNGQSVSAEKSFIVHRGNFYLGIALDKYFLNKGEASAFRIKSVDTKGAEVAVNNIDLEISKITWEYFKRKEVDGGYYYQSSEKREVVKKIKVDTDKNGNYNGNLAFDSEGEYEIKIITSDSAGNKIKSTRGFYVYGSAEVSIRPENNETLNLVADKTDLNVGETASFIIQSPFPKAKALISFERGKIFDYEIIDITGSLAKYTFKVKENYLPNIYATVLLLSPEPSIKYGQINYKINTDLKSISVNIKSDKNSYLPGEKVNLSITAHDSSGRPLQSELSVAVVDVSVLALKGNPKKNPLVFFYDGMPLAVTTASNIKNILNEVEIPAGTKGGSGGGAEAAGDLARKKRGEFRDTAIWRGVVETDLSGNASVSFILPDNLTTWQAEAVGITKDTKLGVGYGEFVSKKDLMVTPLFPRFIVPGDEFSIGAKVFNNTRDPQVLNVSFASDTLPVLGENREQKLNLATGETKTVYFPLIAPSKIQEGKHVFIVSAKNANYEDTVENTIPITRNETYEATATAFSTDKVQAKEYVYLPANVELDKGGATIKTSATLATYLSDALNYLVQYPYGCSEQIASKLRSIAILKKGLNIKNVGDKFKLQTIKFNGNEYSADDLVKIGLTRIYENQNYDGGFVYYRGLQSNPYLTLHIINTLKDIEDAGYQINKSAIDNGASYLLQRINYDSRLSKNKDFIILTAYSLSRVEGKAGQNADLRNRVLAFANDSKFINENISSDSLAYLAILLTGKDYPSDVRETVIKQLENRISIDSRGAYLPINKSNWLMDYYETPVKNTALLIKVFSADKRDNPVTDKVIRWLLRSRAKDGSWGSTNNTVSVIDALTDFLMWKKETESDFKLAIKLDDKDIAGYDFNKDTVLDIYETFISMDQFKVGELSRLEFDKINRNMKVPNNFYYDISFKYFLPVNLIPPRDEGFSIVRNFYSRDDADSKNPLEEVKVGDVLRGRITVTTPKARNFINIEDIIPAGMELVNFNLATEDQSLKVGEPSPYEDYNYYGEGYIDSGSDVFAANPGIFGLGNLIGGINLLANAINYNGGSPPKALNYDDYQASVPKIRLNPDQVEYHDDRIYIFKEYLSPGVYEFDYYARALIPGKYLHLPAVASEMYFPENFGRTAGSYFTIVK
jgi:hypothetical protein